MGVVLLTDTDDNTDESASGREQTDIDRGLGSGSLSKNEAWVEQSAQPRNKPNDGRYETRTTFLPHKDDVDDSRTAHQLHRDPEDRRSWSELAKWNDGMYDSDRAQQNFDADVRRWTATFCDFLDLPSYQFERVDYVVSEVDFEAIKQHRLPTEKVIVAVISLVVDAETSVDDPNEWDLDDWIIYDDDFEQLMHDVDMDRSELWTARKLVHEQVDYFDDEDT